MLRTSRAEARRLRGAPASAVQEFLLRLGPVGPVGGQVLFAHRLAPGCGRGDAVISRHEIIMKHTECEIIMEVENHGSL